MEPEIGVLVLIGVHLFGSVFSSSAFLLGIVEHSGLLEILFLSSEILVTLHRVRVQSLARITKFRKIV